MGTGRRSVQAHRDKWVFARGYFPGKLRGAQYAVGLQGEDQVFFPDLADQFKDAGMQEGLPSGQLHRGKPHRLRLFNDRAEEVHRQLRGRTAFPLEGGRNPAMAAGQVTACGEIEI